VEVEPGGAHQQLESEAFMRLQRESHADRR